MVAVMELAQNVLKYSCNYVKYNMLKLEDNLCLLHTQQHTHASIVHIPTPHSNADHFVATPILAF